MFNQILKHARERLDWHYEARVLNSIREMEAFRQYLSKVQSKQFLLYQEASSHKRFEFAYFVKEFDINVKGINFLDIGPGYGDSLDICHEMGAKHIDFVEIHPVFFTYNRLKGFTNGYRFDHMIGLRRLEPARYDLIWVKGSVSADFFISSKFNIKNFWLSHWLTQLERLASSTCHIVICPHWANDSQRRDIVDARHNLFAETMLNKDYVILTELKNHNHEPEYPITFYKNTARIRGRLSEGKPAEASFWT